MRSSVGSPSRRRIAAFVAAMLLGVTAADAAGRVCRQLEAELASADGGGERKYERAIAGQQTQLHIARQRARRAGCGSFGLFSPRSCGPLNEQIGRMEQNLAALERARASAPLFEAPRSRSKILASLEANGCREGEPAELARRAGPEEPEEDAADLFARVFGGRPDQEQPPTQGGQTNVVRVLHPGGETEVYGPSGEFATMCVRTCDGYFFPVSPRSSAAEFERDQKNCEVTCPGTDVQLYYRPIGSDDSSGMMSTANGDLYLSLPNAYRYKAGTGPRVAACGCKGAAVDPDFSIVGGAPQQAGSPEASRDPAAEPEKPVVTVLPPPGERKVRVVGPVFLPDPGAAIDLKAPARKQVR